MNFPILPYDELGCSDLLASNYLFIILLVVVYVI